MVCTMSISCPFMMFNSGEGGESGLQIIKPIFAQISKSCELHLVVYHWEGNFRYIVFHIRTMGLQARTT